jgi:hypothetical protein
MIHLTFNSTGDTYFTVQYNGDILDTAQGIDKWLLQPSEQFPRFCYFNAGQNAGLVDGVTLTGQTSGAVILVGHVSLTGGVVTSTGQGVLFFREISGHIVSGENLRVSTTTYCVATSGPLNCPLTPARSLMIQVETAALRYAIGGATPSNAAATPESFGGPFPAGSSLNVAGWHDVTTFKMIHADSSANAVVTVFVQF